MQRSVYVAVFWALFLSNLGAAELTGEVVDLAKGKPVPNVDLTISLRVIAKDAEGKDHLLPISETSPILKLNADAGGRFTIDVPVGVIAISASHPGLADYVNVLAKIEGDQPNSLRIELASAEPTEEEIAIVDQRRTEAQMIERVREDQEGPVFLPETRAASQPVVPAEVWVSNLEGYTGFINLDEFIAGVVSRELGSSFPYESLKAQAVAARTYALARLRDRGFANGGQAYTSTLANNCLAAASNSSGVALTYNNSYITAFFSARCNGDFTLDSEDGLSGLATCTAGGLVGGQVIPYLRKVACSGHVNCSQTSEQCCDVTVDGRLQHIYGHGVGLCQRGAQNFAGRDGMNWQQIVNRFYTSVTTLSGNRLRLGDRIQTLVNLNRRTVPCTGAANSNGANTLGTLVDGPQTTACTLIAGTSYITWWRISFDNGTRGWVAEDLFKKTPAAQTLPPLQLSVTRLGSSSVQITATGRASVRVSLQESMNLRDWTPVALQTLSVSGATSFTRPASEDGRSYRAILQLPDTSP